jgi:hypothetical protein
MAKITALFFPTARAPCAYINTCILYNKKAPNSVFDPPVKFNEGTGFTWVLGSRVRVLHSHGPGTEDDIAVDMSISFPELWDNPFQGGI